MPKRNLDVDLPEGSHMPATQQQFLPPTTRNQPVFNNQPSTIAYCGCNGTNSNLIDCQAGVDCFNQLWTGGLLGLGSTGHNMVGNQASLSEYHLGPTAQHGLTVNGAGIQHGIQNDPHNGYGARNQPSTGIISAQDLANLYEGPALVDDPENTCVRITGLPTDCGLRDLFYGLAGCGKIYSANISKIVPFRGPRAASVTFWNLRGIQFLVFDFSYQLEDVLVLDCGDWRSLEYRFSSVKEVEQAMRAICAFKERKDIPFAEMEEWKASKVRFGDDPCGDLFGYR
ncbi:hypothetical protein GGR55DRAFT_693397 [Xylaria sp. FL0064]|nr:hypothetical protein GGR55DRAFT_693397 [Xylaria sp. FL0064]